VCVAGDAPLLRELRRNGTIAFVRCPRQPAEHLGHLHELATVLMRRRPRTLLTQELRCAAATSTGVGAGDRHPRVARHPRGVAKPPSALRHGHGLPVWPACAIESSAVFTHFFSAVS
jgi:hypothetical protein